MLGLNGRRTQASSAGRPRLSGLEGALEPAGPRAAGPGLSSLGPADTGAFPYHLLEVVSALPLSGDFLSLSH